MTAHALAPRPVNSLAFAPDGSGFAAGCGNGEVRFFTADGRWRQTGAGHGSWINAVAFSPDSQLVAAGARNYDVWIYELEHGWVLQHLSGHTGFVNSVAFNPGGDILASASQDGTVRLWDTTGWSLLAVRNDIRSILKNESGAARRARLTWLLRFVARPRSDHDPGLSHFQRLRPSIWPVNVAILGYGLLWNLVFLPQTLAARQRDYARVRLVRDRVTALAPTRLERAP